MKVMGILVVLLSAATVVSAQPNPDGNPRPKQPPAPRGARGMSMGNPSPRVVVVSTKPDAIRTFQLEEDLAVMFRILNKSVTPEPTGEYGERLLGMAFAPLMAGRGPQSMFIDDYGALFFLNVPYPLQSTGGEKTVKEKSDVDSAWEEARRELHDQPDFRLHLFGREEGPSEPFDAEKVRKLKNELIAQLKMATNIRDLKSDQSVTIVLTGPSANDRKEETQADRKGNTSPAVRRTTMVLSVKKSEADQFAKGKFDLKDFTKKVSVAEY